MGTTVKITYAALALTILLFAVLVSTGHAATGAHRHRATERWRPIVAQYNWSVEDALDVIDCESEGDPDAQNPRSDAAGGWQLLGWEWKAYQMFGVWSVRDPEVATAVAYEIYKAGGRRFNTRIGWQASYPCHHSP